MENIEYYLFFLILITISEIFVILSLQFLNRDKFKLNYFSFNVRNYYLMLFPLAISFFIVAVIRQSFDLIVLFLLFSIVGIIGETLFSYWWKKLFPKKYFVYKVKTIFNSYSSLLNFIPWGLGGFLFLVIVQLAKYKYSNPIISTELTNNFQFYTLFWIIFISSIPFSILLMYIYRKIRPFDKNTFNIDFMTYLIFSLPMILAVLAISLLYSPDYFLISLGFGVIGFVLEYLLGKMSVFFISKKLWYYNYNTIDNNHTTILNIIPCMAGGFLFWTVALIFINLFGIIY